MNPEVQKRLFKLTPTNIAVITLTTFLLLVLAISAQVAYMFLKYDKVYKGVYIDNLYVGSQTRDEVKDLLKSKYEGKNGEKSITLKSKRASEKIGFTEAGVKYDISGAVDKAYSIGRTGNIFDRLYDIIDTNIHGSKIDVPFTFNKDKVVGIIQSLYDKTFINVKEADLFIQEDKVTVRSGHHGENIDKNKTFSAVEAAVENCDGSDIEVPVIETAPSPINADDYLKKINRDAVDAQAKVENNTVTVAPHMIGRSIDKTALISVVNELEKAENTEKVLPVIFVQPKIKTEDVYARLFKDTLGTAWTQFYSDTEINKARTGNIKLAVAAINGKILAPGQEFSFNNVVGPRTVETGYGEAYTYVGGKVVLGVGGGICQVSSTLYDSALFANLDVTERYNHMFTITYVPLGRDAAVAYGQADFKFKNSTNWPIKIEGWVTNDNKIFFALRGTNETPDKSVELNHKTVKTIDFKTKYIDDPTLEEGKEEIKQKGSPGYVVDTYKIVKVDGKAVSETKLHTSYYQPLDKEIKRGTKKLQPSTATASKTPGTDKAGSQTANPGQ